MLAREITKWTRACDKRLRRLVSYLHSTRDKNLEGFVGDSPMKCDLVVYSDASYADEVTTSKSTSAAFIALVGPNTFAPITALCKKQPVISRSSTESEIVALDTALRTEALPLLTFWECVCEAIRPSIL